MSYEIPQQLEYKEKIIFGLTFSQLLYVVIFSPLVLALLFKAPFDIPYRITLALIPSALAGVFMFTHLPKQGRNWIHWLQWRKITAKKMERYLGLDKIDKTIIFTK